MRRARTILLALPLACGLSAEDKNACRTSSDCVASRICVDGTCNDDPCPQLCDELCTAADECPGEPPPGNCEARCRADGPTQSPLLPDLSDAQCKQTWDTLTRSDRCEATPCIWYCGEVCLMANTCGLVTAPSECFRGCLARADPCPGPAPSDCVSVPGDVICFEAAANCQ